jgi:DNA-binding GntR family transcriptional regulator
VPDTLDIASPIRADYPEPLWVQAANHITAQIADGTLRAGMRLPPERELCEQLAISRVTLRKALGKLIEDGLLSPSHGRGWYVADTAAPERDWPNSLESFSETARRMGLTPTSDVLVSEVRPATLDEGDLLSIAPGTPLFHLERVRRLDDVPIALDSTIIPAALVPDAAAADYRERSLYDTLAAAGLEFSRADATIEAREADSELAGLLGIPEGKPVLVMQQLVVDRGDRPLFSSTIRYSGDRYRLRTTFARRR